MASVLIPRSNLNIEAIKAMFAAAAEVVQGLARGTNNEADITFRRLRAADVNGGTVIGHLVNPAALVANTYSTNATPNFATVEDQAFAICGIQLLNTTPTLDEITITVGADPVAVLPCSELRSPGVGTSPEEGFIFDPVFVGPKVSCAITLLAGSAQTISLEQFNIIGIVGEKNSQIVVGASQRRAAQMYERSLAGVLASMHGALAPQAPSSQPQRGVAPGL